MWKSEILIAGIISIWMIFLNASITTSSTKQVIEKLFINYSLFICLDYYFDWIWYSIQCLYRDTPYIQAKQHKNMTIYLYHNGPYSWALNYIMSFIEIKRNHIFWRHLDWLFFWQSHLNRHFFHHKLKYLLFSNVVDLEPLVTEIFIIQSSRRHKLEIKYQKKYARK